MNFELKTRQKGDVTVIDFYGPITLGVASSVIRNAVREVLEMGSRKILLNLQNVGYIDSYGIGEMVAGYSSVRNAGGSLKLLSLNHRVKEMLAITNLLPIFDVQEDEARGVLSFS
ncbi:MAG TPA: STAS domain-containing protein [Bryobacteraceae bacterium]|jgi:anti-sigma B factor antagonist|nr:STAS domain-containing protein [Bryobacteraceae bacterium]